jgi:3'-5' exoribonuclease
MRMPPEHWKMVEEERNKVRTRWPAKQMMKELRAMAHTLGVYAVADEVLGNPDFEVSLGSIVANAHHQYKGGLLEHTYEVIKLCELNLNFLTGHVVNRQHLFLAGLFHDYGKLWDQTCLNGEWVKTKHCREVHHISRSAIEWTRAADKHGIDEMAHYDVLHAILAHHGQREWGSPVAPKSRLAWLLHISDQMSARMNDADTLDIIGNKK